MRFSIAVVFCVMTAISGHAQEKDNDINNLAWQKSGDFLIADVANLQLSSKMRALQPSDTSRFLELLGNLPRRNSYLVSANDYQWFTVFSYDPSGYVRDNEKIDSDELLTTLKQQNELGNAERQKTWTEATIPAGLVRCASL